MKMQMNNQMTSPIKNSLQIMPKLLYGFFLSVLLFGFIGTGFAKEPVNIETARLNIIRYHDSGAYESDINKIITQALNYLEWRLTQQPTNGKLAIVLDVDETCLSNYKHLVKLNFGAPPIDIRKYDFGSDLPTIEPTLKLFRFAVEHNIPVFFITGRYEKDRADTEKNLINNGFTPWAGIIMRPNSAIKIPAVTYKTEARKHLTEEGYDIILNIGDQQSDINGGYADKTFKLPNPFYIVK